MPLLPLLLLALPIPQEPVDYVGHWEGRIQGAALDIDVDLGLDGEGALTGDISIPAQKAKDLALVNFRLEEGRLYFTIEGVPGDPTFEGTLSDDGATLSGPFVQGKASLSFELRRAAAAEPFPTGGLEALRPWVLETMEGWHVPGLGVAIVTSKEVLLCEGFGVREVDGEAKVDGHTVFAIGSSTKAFTNFALAQAMEAGELGWTDAVTEHLPSFAMESPVATDEVTVRDLVTHRLGLPRHDLMWYGRSDMTQGRIVDAIQYLPMNAKLRERFQYNNLGYIVAGRVLEEVTGTTWDEWIKTRVFDPLVMRDSVTTGAAFLGLDNRAVGHGLRDEPEAAEAMAFRNIDLAGPAGSIGSSAHDMARWAQLQLCAGEYEGNRLLEPGAVKELHTPQQVLTSLPNDPMLGVMSYAHGWFVESYRGHLRLHHGGNIDGYSAMVAFFPDDDLGVVVLSNMNRSAVPEYVVRRAADLAFELEPREWSEGDLEKRATAKDLKTKEAEEGEDDEPAPTQVPGTAPSRDLAQFAGAYEHPGYGTVSIKLLEAEEPSLGFAIGDSSGTLEHWHYDTFRVAESDAEEGNPVRGLLISFQTNQAGDIFALDAKVEPRLAPQRFEAAADPRLRDPKLLAEYVGDYALEGMSVTVRLQGTTVVMTVPGQPPYSLEPARDETFELKEIDGYSVRFERDEDGAVNAMELRQPNGNFTAKRAVPEDEQK